MGAGLFLLSKTACLLSKTNHLLSKIEIYYQNWVLAVCNTWWRIKSVVFQWRARKVPALFLPIKSMPMRADVKTFPI
jgi:hypothetical protein